jgi:tetratricopeptide (TPR) repeat protein
MSDKKSSQNLTAFEEMFMGNFEYSRQIFKSISEKHTTDLHTTATAIHNIAQSYMMEGNLDEAEIYFQKASELYRATNDEYSLALCLSQYALVLRPQLRKKEAEVLLVEVVKVSKKLELKLKDVKNWFLKSYFLNLLQIYGEKTEAIELRNLLNQEWKDKHF